MGSGIAQAISTAGLNVILIDKSSDKLDAALKSINSSLERLFAKQKISQSPDQILHRLSTSTDLSSLHSADFVIEAVSEQEDLKQSIFNQLDTITPPHAILATNTSSISITRLASSTQRSDRIIGLHFMQPVPLMNLVEVIKGAATSKSTFSTTIALTNHLGKRPCVSEDRPGFIVNRILMPMINEAFFALQEGVAIAEDIDFAMKAGTNQPMGPLELADFIGLDTCLAIMRVMHGGLGEDKYRPCPLLVQKVDAGWLGRKTKKGVYAY
jgi:3-hydroxybutyryl-CoA dehydrogenase